MKTFTMSMLAALAAMTCSALSLAEARGKITEVLENPSEATAVMKQLSAADQKAYVAALNDAISKLPGSVEERSAKALSVNSAAVAGSAKGNAQTLIAEVFATAPLESLTAINESFAKDLVNRAADPSKTYTDDQYTNIAAKVVAAVSSRVEGQSDGDVRAAFAALMMIRASNGSPESLADMLAGMLGDSAETAKGEWFPAALGTPADYDPMLAAAGVEATPEVAQVFLIAGPRRQAVLFTALTTGVKDPLAAAEDGFGDWSQLQPVDTGMETMPRTMEDLPWNPDPKRNQDIPKPYAGQNF